MTLRLVLCPRKSALLTAPQNEELSDAVTSNVSAKCHDVPTRRVATFGPPSNLSFLAIKHAFQASAVGGKIGKVDGVAVYLTLAKRQGIEASQELTVYRGKEEI